MASGITGDFATLNKWQKLFENTGGMLEAASRAMAEETVDLIKQGFRSETDPYGQRWARKKRPDGRKVLSGKTSRLKGGWHPTRTDKGGFVIATSVQYAAYHQEGTRKMVVRKMVPSKSGGLPPEWSKALEEAAVEVMESYYSSGGGGGGGGGVNFIAAKIAGVRRGISRKTSLKGILMRAVRAASSG